MSFNYREGTEENNSQPEWVQPITGPKIETKKFQNMKDVIGC